MNNPAEQRLSFYLALAFILSLIVFLFSLPTGSFAQSQRNPCYYTSFPGATGTTGCIPVSVSNPLPITGSFSATTTGFPGTTQTTGTPIAVTTGGVTGTLPAGAVVAAFNVGTTNTAFCKLGASSSTSDVAIPPASWFAFTVGANTQLTCITSTSTTTVNMVGGAGLPTGAGGGAGGSGGGGAVTVANGADTAEGTTTDAVCATPASGTACTMIALAKAINNNVAAAVPAGTNLIGKFGIDQTTDGITNGVRLTNPYPTGAIPITASATGTTAATTATLAANATLKTYVCGFSIRANATAAVTNNATVTGTVTGTLNYTQWTAPAASGLGVAEQIFSPCIPSSAINTAIAVISGAPGTAGIVSVTAWGFQL